MDPLRDLLAVDQHRALEFFVTGLTDVSGHGVDRQQLLYNASILAHYTQVSTQACSDMPAPTDLGAVFDQFVLNTAVPHDSVSLEAGAVHCLLLTGFFEDQMRGRHSIRWFAEFGAGLFNRAATRQQSPAKAQLLTKMARHFESWRQRNAQLARELRDQPYVLTNLIKPPIGG